MQPLIPAYRVPVFERLAASPDIDLTVWAGSSCGSLISFPDRCNFRCYPAPLHEFGPGIISFKWQFNQLKAVLERDCDAIVFSWDAHYLSLFPALALAKSRRLPTALWGHGYSKRGDGLRDFLRNWYGRRTDAVILYTKTIAHELIEQGYDARRVFVAQNAIDQAPIQNARSRWSGYVKCLKAFRTQHGLDPEQTILFVSRLEPDNHLEMLIEGFATFQRDRASAKLVIIGDGADRVKLESMVAAYGIGSKVIFTGAIFVENEIAPWMMSATVFCYPSNIGLSILHAFGYGLPVVTHDNIEQQNPEVEALRHGQSGFFYRQGDVTDMMRQCSRIIGDRDLRRDLSENCLKLVEQEYTLEAMVESFVQVARFLARR
ncbi:glycosyltransferase [Thiocystis violacea]|uniref:glycosyltransferase n=1 Tax=Thiocystis violacea TaxID=13725 RepID=UPI001905B537